MSKLAIIGTSAVAVITLRDRLGEVNVYEPEYGGNFCAWREKSSKCNNLQNVDPQVNLERLKFNASRQ